MWLGPHANTDGWDDSLAQLNTLPLPWRAYFLGESLDFWKSVTWQSVELRLADLPLDKAARNKLKELVVAWDTRSLTGNWPPNLLRSSPERIERALGHISINESVPSVIVCVNRVGQWQLADGYHRLAAAFIASPPPKKPVRVWLAQNAA